MTLASSSLKLTVGYKFIPAFPVWKLERNIGKWDKFVCLSLKVVCSSMESRNIEIWDVTKGTILSSPYSKSGNKVKQNSSNPFPTQNDSKKIGRDCNMISSHPNNMWAVCKLRKAEQPLPLLIPIICLMQFTSLLCPSFSISSSI